MITILLYAFIAKLPFIALLSLFLLPVVWRGHLVQIQQLQSPDGVSAWLGHCP